MKRFIDPQVMTVARVFIGRNAIITKDLRGTKRVCFGGKNSLTRHFMEVKMKVNKIAVWLGALTCILFVVGSTSAAIHFNFSQSEKKIERRTLHFC